MAKKTIDLKEYARGFHSQSQIIHPPSPTVEATDDIEIKVDRKYDTYVYYFGDGKGRVKIGYSANPWSRCAENKTFNPDLTLLAVERGKRHDERRRHLEFQDEHLALEWFTLSPRIQKHIDSLNENLTSASPRQ